MKLYNQTKNFLKWDLSLTQYTCEPYGEVEVPDMFVMHCKKRGLPLDITPVAPEVKASKSLEGASEAAKKDEIVALQKTLSEALASEKSAKDELAKVLAREAVLEKAKLELEVSVSSSVSKYDSLLADHNALVKLSDEQAKEFEIAKLERDRALATVKELSKPAVVATPVKDDKPAKK